MKKYQVCMPDVLVTGSIALYLQSHCMYVGLCKSVDEKSQSITRRLADLKLSDTR